MAFSLLQKKLIYQALIHAIRTYNLRAAFYNADPGDPVYKLGAEGKPSASPTDSPEQSELFQMLCSLTEDLGEDANPPIRTWQDFCRLAIEGYRASLSDPSDSEP